jgi:RND superfamily putative drug exporter
MIGLGVGVDYALLLVEEFRRWLAEGLEPAAAARRAVQRLRGTILCSGTAVAIGFLALCLVRLPFLKALAFGGIAVVVAAIVATLTLLPPLLAVLGPRVNWPASKRRKRDAHPFWSRWARRVMERPVLWSGLALAVLVGFVLPVFRMEGWNLGASGLPADLEARRGYEILRDDFAPGWIGPNALVIEAQPGRSLVATEARSAIETLAERLQHDPRVALVRVAAPTSAAEPQRVSLMALIGWDPPESKAAARLVEDLRGDSASELRAAGLTVHVTGAAAMLADFDHEIFSRLWLVVPAVLALTFLMLMTHLRSLVLPVKAIVLNLLSVLASYGFLVLIFQDGHGAGLLGLDPPGGLNAFIVLLLFTILFGLSMDYEVFLLSRIRTEYLVSRSNGRAVEHGVATTGSVITSAAAIMVALFLAFGFTRLTATREFGLGLAFAVALDATLVRLVLVPALMALMGEANWWWPARSARWREVQS